MVYRFTIISNEVEDFIREIKIDAEATFTTCIRPYCLRATMQTMCLLLFSSVTKSGNKNRRFCWKTWAQADRTKTCI